MKIIDGIEIIKVNEKKFVAVSTGDATKVCYGLINLNETAYNIWLCIKKGLTIEEIATQFSNEYQNLVYEEAYKYIKDFVDKLIEKGIVIQD